MTDNKSLFEFFVIYFIVQVADSLMINTPVCPNCFIVFVTTVVE